MEPQDHEPTVLHETTYFSDLLELKDRQSRIPLLVTHSPNDTPYLTIKCEFAVRAINLCRCQHSCNSQSGLKSSPRRRGVRPCSDRPVSHIPRRFRLSYKHRRSHTALLRPQPPPRRHEALNRPDPSIRRHKLPCYQLQWRKQSCTSSRPPSSLSLPPTAPTREISGIKPAIRQTTSPNPLNSTGTSLRPAAFVMPATTLETTPLLPYIAAVKPRSEMLGYIPPTSEDIKHMFEQHDAFAVNDEGDTLLGAVAERKDDDEYDDEGGSSDEDPVTLFRKLMKRGLNSRRENKQKLSAARKEEVLKLFERED